MGRMRFSGTVLIMGAGPVAWWLDQQATPALRRSGLATAVVVLSSTINDTTTPGYELNQVRVARLGPGRPVPTGPGAADKGYSRRANRRMLVSHGIPATVPSAATQLSHGAAGGRPSASTRDLQAPQRRRALFQPVQAVRAIVTRYDNSAVNYRDGVLASIILWRKP